MDTMPANDAVEALVHQYYKLVFHTIYGLTNNWEESQDLTQDTFHQALKGIDAARATSGVHFNAKAWLLRIALNTVRMQRRRQAIFDFVPFSHMLKKRREEPGDTSETNAATVQAQATPVQPGGYGTPGTGTNDPAETIAEQDAVQRTMATLSEDFRVCLLLSIVGGLSNSEIAAMLGMKEPAIRQRLARARKQFQQLYEQESGEHSADPTNTVQHNSPTQQGGKKTTRNQAATDTPHHLSLAAHPPKLRSSYV